MADNDDGLDSYKEIQADAILAQIREGKSVECHHKIIKGSLDVNELEENNGKYIIAKPIAIVYSRFTGNVDFSDTIFEESINFSGSKFNGYTYFDESQFCKDASFIGAQFCKAITFANSEFKGNANFVSVKFYGPNYFNTLFDSVADFSNSWFNKPAHFSGCRFKKTASFANCRFNERVNFWLSKFNEDANFNESKFNETAFFEGSSFEKQLDLNGSRMHFMNLYAKFNEGSTISLKRSDFFRLEVPWDDIKDRFDYDGSAYLALVKNYNNLEWFDDADRCYYQYKLRRASSLRGISRFMDFISWIAYGYGVRPEFPLITLSIIFFISTIIYLLEGVANFPEVFRLSATILTTTTETGNLTGEYMWWSLIERIAGWLLMASFLVVFARKTIR